MLVFYFYFLIYLYSQGVATYRVKSILYTFRIRGLNPFVLYKIYIINKKKKKKKIRGVTQLVEDHAL